MQESRETKTKRFNAATWLLVLIVAYAIGAIYGLPQYGSQLILDSAHHETVAAATGEHGTPTGHAGANDDHHPHSTAVFS